MAKQTEVEPEASSSPDGKDKEINEEASEDKKEKKKKKGEKEKKPITGVQLSGFESPHLNSWYWLRSSPEWGVNGKETYWKNNGNYFLYWFKKADQWRVGEMGSIEKIQNGEDCSCAGATPGKDLLDPGFGCKGWFELSPRTQWEWRPEAGVTKHSHDKVEEPPIPEALQKKNWRYYVRCRPLPWWICFFIGFFLLIKFQVVYNDSPCAVLGTTSPTSRAEVKRAFRQLSMCTHPDRLRGRLKRDPEAAETRRGEIIFNRASAAKSELEQMLQRQRLKEVLCYQGELETAVMLGLAELWNGLSSMGLGDVWTFCYDLCWSIVTLEAGLLNTILSCLWFMFMFRMFHQFGTYLWRMGVIRFTMALVTTLVIGPIPTIVQFFSLPFMRVAVWIKYTANLLKSEGEDNSAQDSPKGASAGTEKDGVPETPMPSSAAMPVATEKNPAHALRQRKKKETDDVKQKRQEDLLTGATDQLDPGKDGGESLRLPMPDKLWDILNWSHPSPLKARQAAAGAIQFDLLLILTKPVIPLGMLLTTGQVWNGLLSSMFTGWALRKVKTMSNETHHCLCFFFGLIHTILGVSAAQMEQHAGREQAQLLHLSWSWSFKDVLQVLHMGLLGATVTSMSSLGNEPSFAASFSSGIALRVILGQDSVQSWSVVQYLSAQGNTGLHNLGVAIDSSEESVAYSGGGIGDCGGGPFRMLLGEGEAAVWASRAFKAFLIILPALSALQWVQRSWRSFSLLGDKKRRKVLRLMQRTTLAIFGVAQCLFLCLWVELNASNGPLGNFWVAMLFGSVGESLMSTYDCRGTVRQVIFLILFIFI